MNFYIIDLPSKILPISSIVFAETPMKAVNAFNRRYSFIQKRIVTLDNIVPCIIVEKDMWVIDATIEQYGAFRTKLAKNAVAQYLLRKI